MRSTEKRINWILDCRRSAWNALNTQTGKAVLSSKAVIQGNSSICKSNHFYNNLSHKMTKIELIFPQLRVIVPLSKHSTVNSTFSKTLIYWPQQLEDDSILVMKRNTILTTEWKSNYSRTLDIQGWWPFRMESIFFGLWKIKWSFEINAIK